MSSYLLVCILHILSHMAFLNCLLSIGFVKPFLEPCVVSLVLYCKLGSLMYYIKFLVPESCVLLIIFVSWFGECNLRNFRFNVRLWLFVFICVNVIRDHDRNLYRFMKKTTRILIVNFVY